MAAAGAMLTAIFSHKRTESGLSERQFEFKSFTIKPIFDIHENSLPHSGTAQVVLSFSLLLLPAEMLR